jgi:hypothetical protein
MRIMKLRKNTGCILEVVVFDNGFTVACWQTDVPEVAVYQNLEQFFKVRTKERGYEVISDKTILPNLVVY